MKDDDILKEAKDKYEYSASSFQHIYDEAKKDLKFVYDIDDGQWPSPIRQSRTKDGRPIITCNKLQKFVRSIRGDAQQNRPRVKVIPVDSNADVNMAEIYNGIIRQIEYQSDAGIAYDTAYANAVASSIGYFRLRTDYIDNESFNQDIFIDRVPESDAIHLDPDARDFEFSDGSFGFIEELMDKDTFKKRFKGASDTDFSGRKEIIGDWILDEKIRLAEYFYKDTKRIKLVLLSTGEAVPITGGVTEKDIKDRGFEIIRDRFVDETIVRWCLINGYEILDRSDWPGKYIPIIPVFGDEIVIDNKRYYLSLTRGARGPQEMYNYWATAATESVALAPKVPVFVDHRQIKGFEPEWEQINRSTRPFVRYNAIAGLQKPSRESQIEVPAGIMAMMQQTAFDIEDHLGRYESSKGEASNERSGKAIIARINQSDKGTYTFVDNYARAIIFCGKQIINLIPKVYDAPRAMIITGEDGTQQLVDVNQPVAQEDGTIGIANDLTVGRYDLIASVGATYVSKRQEMVEMMIQSMQYAPQLAPIIAPLIFKYSDWPGASEIYAGLTQEIQKQQELTQQAGEVPLQ